MLNADYFKNKNYELPSDLPPRTSHKYMEVINEGFAKYLEVAFLSGGFVMYKQVIKLMGLFEGKGRTEDTNEKYAYTMVKRLEELGFIKSDYINRNKVFYLRKPALVLVTNNANTTHRVNIAKDLKNDKFKIAILKVEYFIEFNELLHHQTMFEQLKLITKDIYSKVQQTGNIYNYDLDSIQKILLMDSYEDILKYLQSHEEHIHRLEVVRQLWEHIGKLYQKLILQRQTVTSLPAYGKCYIKEDGRAVLHYIPNIVIFDVSHDSRYYKERCVKLFYEFTQMSLNVLRGVQSEFIKSKGKSVGFMGDTHIGYRLMLIGDDKEVLEGKKKVIDENINSSVISPLMDYTTTIELNIAQYLLHASRKMGELSEKQNMRINKILLDKAKPVERGNSSDSTSKSKNTINEELLKLIE